MNQVTPFKKGQIIYKLTNFIKNKIKQTVTAEKNILFDSNEQEHLF